MACVVDDPSGRRRIQFVAPDRSKKTVRLGKVDRKTAESICRHVEALLSAKITGQPVPRDTSVWLAGIGDQLRQRLAAVGLIERPTRATLGAFLDRYINNRKAQVARGTILNMEQARRYLVSYFGEDRDMASITLADAEGWAAHLAAKYAPATAGRAIKRARQFFKAALRDKLVADNVFLELKASGQPNKERQYHVDRETIFRVIDAAPDAEWRLIIALSRFGGLRCPTEHLALRWEDVNWERGRFRVASPKTGERWVPIFPELRPYLEEAFELARPGAEYVITRYRDSNANLRTQFQRIIRRAGEKPWPKLFHNLRASRETELAAEYPIHIVCAWIGNSARVAAKHYLTVREEDYARASGAAPGGSGGGAATEAGAGRRGWAAEAATGTWAVPDARHGRAASDAKSDAKSDALVTQKATPQGTAAVSGDPQKFPQLQSRQTFTRRPTKGCALPQNGLVPPAGVERGQKTQRKLGVHETRDAQSDAISIRHAGPNNDLLTPPSDVQIAPADVEAQPKGAETQPRTRLIPPRGDKAQPAGDLTRQASDAKPANNPADLLAGSGSDTTKGKGGKVAKVLSALSALSATPKTLEKVKVLADNKADKTGKTLVSHVRRDDAKPALDIEALVAAIGALSPAEKLRLLEALAGTGQAHAPRPVADERP